MNSKEVINFIEFFIKNNKCDASKIIAVGGSYGGYLTCIFLYYFVFNFFKIQ